MTTATLLAEAQAEATVSEAQAAADEAARIGAAARRKERREAEALALAEGEAAETGRPTYWQRKQTGTGRPSLMVSYGNRYRPEALAALAAQAAGKAAGRAAEGRLVKGGRRVGRVTLSEFERESLTAEAAILALEAAPGDLAPERGTLAAALGEPDLAERLAQAEALAPRRAAERADLLALTAALLARIAHPEKGGSDDWRDVAAAHRNLTDANLAEAQAHRRTREGEGRRGAALLAQGQAEAEADAMTAQAGPESPLPAEAEAALYLGPWTTRERKALRAALTGSRAALWTGRREGAATPGAWHKVTNLGRKALRESLADRAKRRTYCEALADLAEAAEGRPARSREAAAEAWSLPALIREPGRKAAKAPAQVGPGREAAARMARLYLTRGPGREAESLARDLAASWRQGREADDLAEALRQSIRRRVTRTLTAEDRARIQADADAILARRWQAHQA